MSRNFRSAAVITIVACLLSRAAGHWAMAQAQQNKPQLLASQGYAQSRPVSLPHLYWHFLIYQHHLDQLAAKHEKQGKDGTWLRSYLQTKLSMTDEEFQPIRESADRLDSAITSLNAQAKADASAYNAARSKEGASSWDAQHYRHELRKLTEQREAAIKNEIDTLNASLSPDAAQKLQDYVKSTFSKYVSIVPVNPNQGPSQPFGPTAATGKVQP